MWSGDRHKRRNVVIVPFLRDAPAEQRTLGMTEQVIALPEKLRLSVGQVGNEADDAGNLLKANIKDHSGSTRSRLG
jgi:hypothetical protein